MPYEVHLRNRETPQPINVAGVLVATRIVPETPPLQIVETVEDARKAMAELIAQGAPLGDIYAVGWDAPARRQLP